MRLTILLLALFSPLANAACTASGSINFGTYNPFLATPTTSSTNINLNCDNTTTVTLSMSTGTSGIFTTRTMKSGNNELNYNLYADNGMNTVWGNGTNGTYQYSGSTNGTPLSIVVFGKIPSKQNVVPGTYADSLIIEMSY